MNNLRDYLIEEKSANKIIYPSTENILAALKLTPLDKTKAVSYTHLTLPTNREV